MSGPFTRAGAAAILTAVVLASPTVVRPLNADAQAAPSPQPAASAQPVPSPAPTGGADALSDRFYQLVDQKKPADAVPYGRQYLVLRPNDAAFQLDLAYAEQDAGLKTAAAADFGAALARDPSKTTALLDYAYLEVDLDRHAAAIVTLQQYLVAKPGDDRARLQLAYEYDSVNDDANALATFTALQTATDPQIAQTAQREVRTRLAQARADARGTRPDRGEIDAYAQDESRFDDGIFGIDARYLLGLGKIEPYVAIHFEKDTRSGQVLGEAQVFEDNVIVTDVGLRTSLDRGNFTYAFAEAGQGTGLAGQGTITDLRYGFAYSRQTGSDAHGVTEIDASVAHYSRYINTIGYFDGAHDFPLAGILHGVYGANAALDQNRDYGNNYAEAFAGVQVATRDRGIILRVSAVEGSYLSRGVGNPGSAGYFTLRPELLVSRSF